MATKEAPWKATFVSHLDAAQNANVEVQVALATVTTPSNLPRVRLVGHAGFWSVKPAGSGIAILSSCPTFVTDSRSKKVAQVFGKMDKSHQDRKMYGLGSGGGGPVEATYWLESVKMQWRLRGKCFFVVDGHAAADALAGEAGARWEQKRRGDLGVTKAAVRPHMMAVAEGHEVSEARDGDVINDDSIWEAEVQGYYQQLSSDLQTSFSRPNFTVGIIVPEEVEMMDLTDATVARRRIWKCTETVDDGAVEWAVIRDNI